MLFRHQNAILVAYFKITEKSNVSSSHAGEKTTQIFIWRYVYVSSANHAIDTYYVKMSSRFSLQYAIHSIYCQTITNKKTRDRLNKQQL